jgi:hypothetical protein
VGGGSLGVALNLIPLTGRWLIVVSADLIAQADPDLRPTAPEEEEIIRLPWRGQCAINPK